MIDAFHYQKGELYAEGLSVTKLANMYATPLYIYSRTHFQQQYRALVEAMSEVNPIICFAIKSNSNAAVIRTFADEGAGADVVSAGEIFRAKSAGIPADRIVFAGVGKSEQEIEYALHEDILCFTVESEPELTRISDCARRCGRNARVDIRVNPDVDPKTHKYTSTGKKENKFGVDLERALRAYEHAATLPHIEIAGLHMHIGSPIMLVQPYAEALEKVIPICRQLKKLYPTFQHIDIGGGLGISYKPDEPPFDLPKFSATVRPLLKDLGLKVIMEPGRFLTGNGGILVTEVQYVKEGPCKKFVVIDAAMNDLIRPALYQAYHHVLPVHQTSELLFGDLVGPVCESGDFIAQDRKLPASRQGDILAILGAGAYGYVMASTYNSRGRPAEVMVSNNHVEMVRSRETLEDLVRGEQTPQWP